MPPHTIADSPTSGTGTGTFTASAGPKSTYGAGSSKTGGKSRGSSRRRKAKEKQVNKLLSLIIAPTLLVVQCKDPTEISTHVGPGKMGGAITLSIKFNLTAAGYVAVTELK